MQFNSDANNLDLYSDCREWCGIAFDDTDSYPIENFTKNANMALDVVSTWIMRSDGNWPWGDTNNTSDYSIADDDLIAGQSDYSIPGSHLKVHRLRVKDSQGVYHIVEPVNRRDLTDTELNAEDGLPKKYYQIENSYFLVPAPSSAAVTTTEGLEVTFQRGASYFVTTDTSKQPGFASPFHRLISMMPALDYCEQNGLEARAAKLRSRIGTPPDISRGIAGSGMAKDIVEFYSFRDVDQGARIIPQKEDYGESGMI